MRIATQVVFAIFKPLGCICWRQMRSSPKSLPRFSGEDFLALSSVMLFNIYSSIVNLVCLCQLDYRLSRWFYGWKGCVRLLKNTVAGSLRPCSRRIPWQAPTVFSCLDFWFFLWFFFSVCIQALGSTLIFRVKFV
jgi:hypothetical protein